MEDFPGKREGKKSIRDTVRGFSIDTLRSQASVRSKLIQYELEVKDLREKIRHVEHNSEHVERHLEKTLGHYEALKRKYHQVVEQLGQGRRQNEKLVHTLREAKDNISTLKKEVEKLCTPPNSYGVFRQRNKDGTIDLDLDGRHLRVNLHPKLEFCEFSPGQLLVLNESLNIIEVGEYENRGEVVRLLDRLDDSRVLVVGRADEERVVMLTEYMRDVHLDVGDNLLLEPRSSYVLEKLPKSQVEEVILEEVPDVSYDDIGGLDDQIGELRDGIELPYLYPDEFREHRLRPPKGVLLYGPPGCGKTLIAKAVANSLGAEAVRAHRRRGAQLLPQHQGAGTAQQIRRRDRIENPRGVQEGARKGERNDARHRVLRRNGRPVPGARLGYFVGRGNHRGGANSCPSSTAWKSLENVIIIGASNRQDLIDPAVLRPGRLDVKIKVDRPGRAAAKDIFSKYLVPDLPLHDDVMRQHKGDREAAVAWLIEQACEHMYSTHDENRFLEVTYAKGDREVFYFKDFRQRRHDREHRRAGQEDGPQAPPGGAGKGAEGRRPDRRRQGGIQGERGPPSRTPRTPTTGRASRAPRVSGSSTSAR